MYCQYIAERDLVGKGAFEIGFSDIDPCTTDCSTVSEQAYLVECFPFDFA